MADDNVVTRVTTLEERLAYQDETIEALNKAVTEQWAQIDKLTRLIEVLNNRFREIESKVAQNPVNERPPHY